MLDERDAVESAEVDDEPLGPGELERPGFVGHPDEGTRDRGDDLADRPVLQPLSDRPGERVPGDRPVFLRLGRPVLTHDQIGMERGRPAGGARQWEEGHHRRDPQPSAETPNPPPLFRLLAHILQAPPDRSRRKIAPATSLPQDNVRPGTTGGERRDSRSSAVGRPSADREGRTRAMRLSRHPIPTVPAAASIHSGRPSWPSPMTPERSCRTSHNTRRPALPGASHGPLQVLQADCVVPAHLGTSAGYGRTG